MIRATKILTLTAALLGALVAASGCGKAVDQTDSESHFLTFCAGECADGLSCVCGVCTRTCEDDSACQSVAFGARCAPLAVSSCAATSGELACDVECGEDADCGGLNGTHECLSGRCRARGSSLSSDAIDAGVIVSSPEVDDRPVLLPALVEGCCPQIAIRWGAYALDDNCRFSREGVPVDLCESQLPTTCNDPVRIDGADISAALLHPDVLDLIQRARNTRAPALVFGWNGGDESATPYALAADFYGPQRGSETFYAGVYSHDCSEVVNGVSAASDCLPIPEGVRAYAELEQTLLLQQLSLGTCAPDLGCYQPVAGGPCESNVIGATYDVASGRCVARPYCGVEGNDFESPLACAQSCDNDPCARGELVIDESCSGTIARPLAAPLSPRCFSNQTQACICACAQTGNSLDSCIVQQGVQPEAVCGP